MAPTHFDKQRAAIIAAARTLFVHNSYQNTTTRQLNLALHTAPGTLYYYFKGGKRALLDAIVAQGEHWPAPPTWRLGRPQDESALEQQLLASIAALWADNITPERFELMVLVIHERALLRDDQVSWMHQRFEALAQSLSVALAALPEAVAIPPAKCRPFADTILALYQKVLIDAVLLAPQPLAAVDLYQRLQPGIHLLVSGLAVPA
jgi:AcrR family transcriptional regulator